MTREGTTLEHMPALDGLRGLAVLAVIAFHADPRFRGGYLGVDLFFVLSGYLITSLLLAEHEARGAIDLRGFWVRRARRLLPALFVLVPCVALYAYFFAKPEEIANIRGDALATLGYVANWRGIYAHKSYWQIFAAPSPLEHTWSLAIEEQFYVVWPLVTVATLAALRRGRRALLVVCLVLAAASAAAMAALWDPARSARAYMGSDTRAAAILAGAALATVLRPGTKLGAGAARALDVAGGLALVGLGAAWARLGEGRFLYHGGFWLTEVASLVLVACAVTVTVTATERRGRASFVARAFAFRPLALVGTISYGLYLWHWPIDVVLTRERIHLGAFAGHALRLGLLFAIAVASYFVVERPIRRRGIFFARPAIVVPSAAAFAVAAVLVGTVARAESTLWPSPSASASASASPAPPPSPGASGVLRAPLWDKVPWGTLPPAAELPPNTLRVLVIGDSVAQYLGNVLRPWQAAADVFVAQRGVGACSIREAEPSYVNGQRIEGTSCAETWKEDVAELRPDVTFVVLGGGYLGPRTCEPDWRASYQARFDFLVDRMGADAGLLVIAIVPYPMERWRDETIIQRVDCFNATLAEVAREKGGLTLDLKSHVCPTTACNELSDGELIRPDGLHFNGHGADETAAWTLAELNRLAKSRAR